MLIIVTGIEVPPIDCTECNYVRSHHRRSANLGTVSEAEVDGYTYLTCWIYRQPTLSQHLCSCAQVSLRTTASPDKSSRHTQHPQATSSTVGRALAAKGTHIRVGDVVVVHRVDCSIKTQNSCDTGAQKEDSVPQVPQQLLLVSSHPPLYTTILVLDNSSGRVERVVGENSITLGFECNHQSRWEGIGKV